MRRTKRMQKRLYRIPKVEELEKCKVFRTKIQHCRNSSGKTVKAGKNCTDGKIDADRFPK